MQPKNRLFTREEVLAIRTLGLNHTAPHIARIYGCGAETIRRILRFETYLDIGEPFPPSDQDEGAVSSSLTTLQDLLTEEERGDTLSSILTQKE